MNILQQIPWLEIGLYFSMIMGMAAKYLYDELSLVKRKKFRFRKWQFLRPIIISPIVFGVIYGLTDETTSPILLFMFSFQNGFFWQTILNKPETRDSSNFDAF